MVIGFALLGFLFFTFMSLHPQVHRHLIGQRFIMGCLAWLIAASVFTGIGAGIGFAFSLIIGSFV